MVISLSFKVALYSFLRFCTAQLWGGGGGGGGGGENGTFF